MAALAVPSTNRLAEDEFSRAVGRVSTMSSAKGTQFKYRKFREENSRSSAASRFWVAQENGPRKQNWRFRRVSSQQRRHCRERRLLCLHYFRFARYSETSRFVEVRRTISYS